MHPPEIHAFIYKLLVSIYPTLIRKNHFKFIGVENLNYVWNPMDRSSGNGERAVNSYIMNSKLNNLFGTPPLPRVVT